MLDTNTVSHLVKAHPTVIRRATALPMASLCISAITEGELQFGLAKRPDAARLSLSVREFMRRVDVLPWGSAAAERYGLLRAHLTSQDKGLAPLDLLIAAHALESNSVLVTNDSAFAQVPALTVEDWTA